MSVRRILGAVLCLGLLSSQVAVAVESQGPVTGTTATQSTSPTQADWTSVTSILVSDDARAAVTIACCDGLSERLTISDWGFTIPDTAAIVGIQIDIEKRGVNVTGTPTLKMYMYRDSGSYVLHTVHTPWGNTEEVLTLGGPTELFGHSWAPQDFGDDIFGFLVQLQIDSDGDGAGTIELDHLTLTIFYQPLTPAEEPVPAVPGRMLLVLALLLGVGGMRLASRGRLAGLP
jgi:hypothetical protein